MNSETPQRTAVVIGASRGLGLAVTRELLDGGWAVTATVRGEPTGGLVELAKDNSSLRTIGGMDITRDADIARLRERLGTGPLDLLYVNAGITNPDEPIGEVTTETFTQVMVTNALAPMRVVEALVDLVAPDGAIAVVSSRQGSISANTRGGYEVYRASKSALNQLMRSYAARGTYGQRTLLLLHPGWVRTELGGSDAPLDIEESARGLAQVLAEHAHDGGLQFLDYQGQIVPW